MHVVLCIVLDLFPFPHLCSVYFVDPLVYLTGFLLIVMISYLLLRPEEVPHQKFAAHLKKNSLIMHKNLLFSVDIYGTKCNGCIVDVVDYSTNIMQIQPTNDMVVYMHVLLD